MSSTDSKTALTSHPRLPWRSRLPGSSLSFLSLALIIILGLFVALPLGQLLHQSLANGGLQVWQDVLIGRVAPNLLWKPLANTLLVGVVVAIGVVVLGGYLAWLVVLTDIPGRALIGALASLPYTVPGFAYALAWETVFRNDRLGGQAGLLQSMGISIPDWLAWGTLPVSLTLLAHCYALSFLLISAALATINVELDEAARMTGASRLQILKDITFVLIMPALVSSALLGFANAVSNFAAPAILGLPVRFETLSTRIFGLMRIGQVERAYVLTVILIVVAASILWGNSRIGKHRSFTTLTGKGGRYKPQRLGGWRWPLLASALTICLLTTVAPLIVLLGSSFTRRTGDFAGGITSHFWIGTSDPAIAQGQPGVMHNPQILNAALNTIWLGLSVAVFASVIGVVIGYVIVRNKNSPLTSLINSLSYLPYFIPGIAFGAIYVAQFGRPIGPFPALYGNLALLIIAAVFHNLPFTAQAGQTAIKQISRELEESATMTGAGFWRRLSSITVPLAARGILAGAALVFVKMVRALPLVVLLVTPTTSVLSIVAFQYASEGFEQFANAITVIIAALSITATLLVQRLQGISQPWLRDN